MQFRLERKAGGKSYILSMATPSATSECKQNQHFKNKDAENDDINNINTLNLKYFLYKY